MIKKTVKYVDFNGNDVEETLYFNITKAELTMMELGKKGGFSEYIKEALKSDDNSKLVKIFTNLVLDAYGVKSEDGKRFIKSDKLREEFKQSAAFSEVFMEIFTDPKLAEEFVKGATNQ